MRRREGRRGLMVVEKMMHDDRWKSLFTDAEFTRDGATMEKAPE